MKKLLILPLMLIVMIAHTQSTFQPGIKAGVNVSNFTGGDFGTIENNAFVSYHAGGYLRFNLGNLRLQPELLVSSQGAKLKDAGNEEDFKVTYLNIPIMLQFALGPKLYIEAGPQFGMKLSEDIPDDADIEDFAKSTDLAVGFGLGYQSKMGLGLGARYNVGLSKVGDFEPTEIDPDFKMGVLQISLFYTFFNKKGK